ncbi:DUF4124 domain-containing protein [Dyella subtropica]|uniref:DUF4124 domain-containing protein n=1 Tax=Dyella subtropica TaxID=2992127 RepID=UPI0022591DCB|nr:DUF4124 domain-containing protein [Dyella subtropica]
MRLPYLALLLLCLLPFAHAFAQTGVHRCIGADGNPLFSDQPCAALKATPVQAAPRPSTPAALAPPANEPPPILCASNVAELRQSVADAFATRDPNRLAGLMLWGGYGRSAAVADIRALTTLMQRPLLDFGEDTTESHQPPPPANDIYNLDTSPIGGSASGDPSPAPTPTPSEHQLVLRTAASDGSGVPHETRFAIVRRSGCLWLRNAE